LPVEVNTTVNSPGREFARKFTNILPELQLQSGIHRRIENMLEDWSAEHPNLRGSYFGREVDPSYLAGVDGAPEALARPKLHGLAIEGEVLHEFVVFAHGIRKDVVELGSIAQLQETWVETKPDEPFLYRAELFHTFGASTILVASKGEAQDAAQEFVSRFRYLRGW
jgi:hypothetical protein